MSKNKYKPYSQSKMIDITNKTDEEVEELLMNGVPEEAETPEVEAETKPEPQSEPANRTSIRGIVIDCTNLNVRVAPNKGSNVVTVIPVDTKLIIIDDSLEDWVKVLLKDGTKGYCMSQFIRTQ